MHYRSVCDLSQTIFYNIHRLPDNIDAVIGVPRSGLLAANILALALNVAVADVDGFLSGRVLGHGSTRKCKNSGKKPHEMKRVLVLDDSILHGNAMRQVREKFKNFGGDTRFIFCAVYGVREEHEEADIVMDTVSVPRIFQWNLMHHSHLSECHVDIDGVLCLDPTPQQNDDGEAYIDFIRNAPPLFLPTVRVGAFVTSRLEKYREHTEFWLRKHGVEYDALHMLDLPSQEERRRLGAHGSFKADIYKKSDAILFIESEVKQAQEISEKSGRPVLCIDSQQMVNSSSATLVQGARNLSVQARRYYAEYRYPMLSMISRRTLGEKGVQKVKAFLSL